MSPKSNIQGIDLFCGAGGLTKGLQNAGIDIPCGVDIDAACRYPYEYNCKANFIESKVEKLEPKEIEGAFDGASFSLMAGCAPCQPFSLYRQKANNRDSKWYLLQRFGQLVEQIEPDLVTMENVPRISEQAVFHAFVKRLKRLRYHIHWSIVECVDYGIPQTRKRLVLMGSKLGPVDFLSGRKTAPKTVRDAIGGLPSIQIGSAHPKDKLHVCSELSDINLKRIRASRPGGTWRDWGPDLVADCHRKKTGKTYPSVYGRMEWDEPAPTLTTQFYGFGNGRFGHPEQDRAITLREGALLQTFPKSYRFTAPGKPIEFKKLGRLIGNAVPVKLGEVIGRSLVNHCENHTA